MLRAIRAVKQNKSRINNNFKINDEKRVKK